MMSRNQENVGRVRLAACRECWRCGVGGRAADGEAIYVVLLLIPHCLEMRPCNAAGASSFAQQGRKVVPAAVRRDYGLDADVAASRGNIRIQPIEWLSRLRRPGDLNGYENRY